MSSERLSPKLTWATTARAVGALRWLALLGLAWGGGAAAAERPTIAALPLGITLAQGGGQNEDVVWSQEATLRQAYSDALAAQSGVGFAHEKEVAAVVSALGRSDFAESDASLSKAAFAAGTLYALFVSVRLDVDGALAATGRVVREDGMAMGGSSARVAWDSARPQEKARELLLQLLAGLKLDKLPAKLEVASATGGFSPLPLPVSSPTSMAPTERAKEAPASEPSTLGVLGVTGGCTGLVGGLLLVALAPLNQQDEQGNIIGNPELVASIHRMQIAGVAFMGVGLVSLAVGIVAFVLEKKPVSALFVPAAGGGALVLVGHL